MATIGNTALTLADWAKRVEDDGRTATIVDLLSQSNQMMEDMLWLEGNQTSGHKTTVRTGIPSGTWRLLYQGVQPTKSTTAQIIENCGNLEAYSQIDKQLADLNGNTAEFRLSEDAAFFEGLTQQMQAALLYSNSVTTPQQIMGFAPRYNSLSASIPTSTNIIDAGGTGSTNTSIWVVGWGPNTCFGVFPKAGKAGLMHEDLGRDTLVQSDGTMYEVYRSHFQWHAGLCVRDWRYIVRICNIDVTLLGGGSAANLINALVSAIHRLPTPPAGTSINTDPTRPSGIVGGNVRYAIYCNRVVASALDRQAMNKTNVLLQMREWNGHMVNTFRGVPIRVVDQLLNTESRIT